MPVLAIKQTSSITH